MAQIIIKGSDIKVEGIILTEGELRFLEKFKVLCKLADEREVEFQQKRKTLLEENHECRRGHSVHSTCHREWQDERKFIVLICNKDLNSIKGVSETSDTTWITFEGSKEPSDLDDLMETNSLLGHGETEEEAWSMALS